MQCVKKIFINLQKKIIYFSVGLFGIKVFSFSMHCSALQELTLMWCVYCTEPGAMRARPERRWLSRPCFTTRQCSVCLVKSLS
jgi:hypothetical protein